MLILFFGCFARVSLVGRHCLTLEGILGDRHGERCWFDCLGGVWAAVEDTVARLRAMAVDCFREISSDEQVFVALVLGV